MDVDTFRCINGIMTPKAMACTKKNNSVPMHLQAVHALGQGLVQSLMQQPRGTHQLCIALFPFT